MVNARNMHASERGNFGYLPKMKSGTQVLRKKELFSQTAYFFLFARNNVPDDMSRALRRHGRKAQVDLRGVPISRRMHGRGFFLLHGFRESDSRRSYNLSRAGRLYTKRGGRDFLN